MEYLKEHLLIVTIARIAHEANRLYCESIGDLSQQAWDYAYDWQHQSAIDGVRHHIQNPNATPEESHENWMQVKLDDGWTWGKVKDIDAKTHPYLVPYEYLSEEQRIKDTLFTNIVKTFI